MTKNELFWSPNKSEKQEEEEDEEEEEEGDQAKVWKLTLSMDFWSLV